jgi:hypothetical protein
MRFKNENAGFLDIYYYPDDDQERQKVLDGMPPPLASRYGSAHDRENLRLYYGHVQSQQDAEACG